MGTDPQQVSPPPPPAPTKPRHRIWGVIEAVCIIGLAAFTANYAELKRTGHDKLEEALRAVIAAFNETKPAAAPATAAAPAETPKPKEAPPPPKGKTTVSVADFERIWKQIAPELLAPKGVPFKKAYDDMLRQFAGEKIDEAFVRKLITELKKHDRVYDGNGYFRSDGKSDRNAPGGEIDPKAFEDDSVSVAFYLDNWRFYSAVVFNVLTKQKTVVYAKERDESGYVFEAKADTTLAEAMKIASDGKVPVRDRALQKGETFTVPDDHLRKVPRLFPLTKSFTDHLGQKRQVTAYLDLATYEDIAADIQSLPDGTVLSNDKGALTVSRDTLVIQRVAGRTRYEGDVTTYVENGKVQIRSKDGRVLYNAFGPAEKTTMAQIFEQDGKEILQMRIEEGTLSLTDHEGNTWRKIDAERVTDAKDRPITDKNDLGQKIRKQILIDGGVLTVHPNLDAFVKTDPFLAKLVGEIIKPYASSSDKAAALLAFTQSFRYQAERVPGSAKTPKAFLLSLEGDCEDASIFTVSLWTAAKYDTGFLYFKNKNPAKPGHAAPVINSQGCCTGAGYDIGDKTWIFGEPTSKDWALGADPQYGKDMVLDLFQHHGGTLEAFTTN